MQIHVLDPLFYTFDFIFFFFIQLVVCHPYANMQRAAKDVWRKHLIFIGSTYTENFFPSGSTLCAYYQYVLFVYS